MQNTLYTFQAKDLVWQRDKEKKKNLFSSPMYLHLTPGVLVPYREMQNHLSS